MKELLFTIVLTLTSLTTNAQSCPDENHPHAIDLGLPSGTLWACCNVGANKPLESGVYYAWGETEEKFCYNMDTYIYWDGYYYYLGSDIAGTQYDVAHVKWGDSWVMPSLTQIQELMHNSTYEFTTINEVNGERFTGPSGGSIFIPAAGMRTDGEFGYFGIGGNYWTSTPNLTYLKNAYRLHFTVGGVYWFYDYFRETGLSVRPVMVSTANINPSESFSERINPAIYNLLGIKVADNTDKINDLHSGIYIVNGRKFAVK